MPYRDKNSPQARAFRERNRQKNSVKSRERYAVDKAYRDLLKERAREYRRKVGGSVINERSAVSRIQRDFRKNLLSSAKMRAAKDNLFFDLRVEDIPNTRICPVFGYPLITAKGAAKPNSFSLDRIDPS